MDFFDGILVTLDYLHQLPETRPHGSHHPQSTSRKCRMQNFRKGNLFVALSIRLPVGLKPSQHRANSRSETMTWLLLAP
jgi:hypothetical protein